MLEKRSLSLAGHRTSIALEPQFWAALTAIATSRQTTLLSIIRTVDETRQPDDKLASALRVFVLEARGKTSFCEQKEAKKLC